jgi:hypothetical protein
MGRTALKDTKKAKKAGKAPKLQKAKVQKKSPKATAVTAKAKQVSAAPKALKAAKALKAKAPEVVPVPKKRGRPAKAVTPPPAKAAAPAPGISTAAKAKIYNAKASAVAGTAPWSAITKASKSTANGPMDVWAEKWRQARQGGRREVAPKPAPEDEDDDEVISVEDSDSDVIALTPPPQKYKREPTTPSRSPVVLPPAVVDLDPSEGVKMSLKSMTAAQIEDAWQTEQGLAHPQKAFTMREVPLSQLEERKAVKRVVQRAICSSAESLAKYEDDYREIFLEDPTYRVLAAYSNGALAGGLAIKFVPDDKDPKGVYVEFLGTKKNAHVGKPMVVQLKQWVKVHPVLEFIALNSLDPQQLKRESPHAVHTCNFWVERGFAQLDQLSLGRLTASVDPSRGALRPIRTREFYKRYCVPEAGDTTVAMIWVPTKPRGDW